MTSTGSSFSRASFEPTCRLSRFGAYSVSEFNRISCSYCYELLKFVFSESEQACAVMPNGSLHYAADNQYYDPTRPADIQVVRDTMDGVEYDKWRACCSEAKICCTDVMALDNLEGKCSSIWCLILGTFKPTSPLHF
jgi:hypothetical protein